MIVRLHSLDIKWRRIFWDNKHWLKFKHGLGILQLIQIMIFFSFNNSCSIELKNISSVKKNCNKRFRLTLVRNTLVCETSWNWFQYSVLCTVFFIVWKKHIFNWKKIKEIRLKLEDKYLTAFIKAISRLFFSKNRELSISHSFLNKNKVSKKNNVAKSNLFL